MKDYSVTITITVPITAASKTQAEERAERLGDVAVRGINELGLKWTGDVEATQEVEAS